MKLKCYSLTVSEICKLFRSGRLVLNPPYQRRPAWGTQQRRDLLSSVFNGIPIPAVILFKTKAGYRTWHLEVMDGKQRLETLLHFRYGRVIKGERVLDFLLWTEDSQRRTRLRYRDLRKEETRSALGVSIRKFLNYEVPVIEYSGALEGMGGRNIAQWEVFTKINSTGSRLTKNEIRHAHSTALFEAGTRLESRWWRRFVDRWRVFSQAEADRYQFHEFLLELCTLFLNDGISDKRERLDHFMRVDPGAAVVRRAEKQVVRVLNWIRAILRDDGVLHSRFRKKADLFSLAGVLVEFLDEGALSRRTDLNRKAGRILKGFSAHAQRIDGKIKKYQSKPLSRRDQAVARYIVATREGTDQLRNRRVRHEFLKSCLEGVFTKRVSGRRLFTRDQKDALWWEARPRGPEGAQTIKCPNPIRNRDCYGRMTYQQCVVDHRHAYAKGGATDMGNAQLLCKLCNSLKRDS
jgi:hypothetical protein